MAWLSVRLLVGLVAFAAAGCSSEPKGQVVATIDGAEVTERELRAELEARGVRAGLTSDAEARRQALQSVIDRKLLAQAARASGIDRQPDFQASVLRQREQLLADIFLQRSSEGSGEPDAKVIAAQLRNHPWRYAGRTMLVVERVGQAGGGALVDSASLAPATAKALSDAALGTRVDVREGGTTVSLIVRKRWAEGLSTDEAAKLAAADLKAENAAGRQQRVLAALRAKAVVRRSVSEREAAK